jgi:hypothetical protein
MKIVQIVRHDENAGKLVITTRTAKSLSCASFGAFCGWLVNTAISTTTRLAHLIHGSGE